MLRLFGMHGHHLVFHHGDARVKFRKAVRHGFLQLREFLQQVVLLLHQVAQLHRQHFVGVDGSGGGVSIGLGVGGRFWIFRFGRRECHDFLVLGLAILGVGRGWEVGQP